MNSSFSFTSPGVIITIRRGTPPSYSSSSVRSVVPIQRAGTHPPPVEPKRRRVARTYARRARVARLPPIEKASKCLGTETAATAAAPYPRKTTFPAPPPTVDLTVRRLKKSKETRFVLFSPGPRVQRVCLRELSRVTVHGVYCTNRIVRVYISRVVRFSHTEL
uniref:Uncharacterized protein n=1 Tax=Sipha flava TaxID=143950 RepID=A0A2S2Q937_9HEMI